MAGMIAAANTAPTAGGNHSTVKILASSSVFIENATIEIMKNRHMVLAAWPRE